MTNYVIKIQGFSGELNTPNKALAERIIATISSVFPDCATMSDYDLPSCNLSEKELELQARQGYFVELMGKGYQPSVAMRAALDK